MADADAPTQEQMDEARARAAKIGLTVRGRKNFVLDDGTDRESCGDFAGLMFKIEWREAVANGQPTLTSHHPTRVSDQRDVRMRASPQRRRISVIDFGELSP